MSQGQSYVQTLTDMAGGLNSDQAVTSMKDNEARRCRNWYMRDGKLVRRGGTTRLTTQNDQGYGNPNSLAQFKDENGDNVMVLGANSGMYRRNGTMLTPLANSDGVTIPVDTRAQWKFKAYRNVLYGAREGGPGLLRITGAYFELGGIDAPTIKPTVADAGAGLLDVAGDYRVVYTYYNSQTGAESNASPVSDPLTLAALHAIAVSALVASTEGQVDTIRLYLTEADQQGEYFHAVGDDVANGTPTGQISLALDDFGDTLDTDNGLPPGGVTAIETLQERLYATDGTDLFRSGIGRPEGWKATDVILVSPDTKQEIRGLCAVGPDRMVIGRTDSMWILTPSPLRVDPLELTIGCVAGFSMLAVRRLLFWFAPDLHVYVWDGSDTRSITADKIHKLIADESLFPDPSVYKYACASIAPELSFYILSIMNDDGSGRAFCFDYRNGIWAGWFDFTGRTDAAKLGVTAPKFHCLGYDDDLQPVQYLIQEDGYLYQGYDVDLEKDENSLGSWPIRCEHRGKGFAPGSAVVEKVLRRAGVQTNVVDIDMTVEVFLDESETAYNSRDVNLGHADQLWKRLSLATLDKPSAIIQLGLSYSGAPAVEVQGVSLQGVIFQRQPKVA